MFRLNPWSARGASHHATFMDNYDYHSHVFSLIHPVDEFSFKEMRTWGQSKILPCCFCVWYKSRKIGAGGVQDSPMVESFSADLPAIESY